YLAAPEVENERRSLNVIYGMRRAGREGRTTGTAPYGYQNVRDALHRSTMVPDVNAPLVREAFDLAAYSNESLESIRRHLRGKGMTLSSTRFHLMLRTPAYIGKNRISPWRDEPGELVDALHEAIVDAAVFHEVQRRRFSAAEDRRAYRKFNPDLPLRRHIVCPNCGGRLTGGAARGRHGGKFPYYWCHHCDRAKREERVRFRANAVEVAVEEYFETLRIEEEIGVLYREILRDVTRGESDQRRTRQGIVRRQLNEVEQKLLRADEMYLESKLDADSYGRLKGKLVEDRARLQAELDAIGRAGGDDLARKIDVAVEVLLNPAKLLKSLSPKLKSDFVGVMAPAGLVYDGEELLNPDPDGLIALFSPETALFGGDGADADESFPLGGPGGI
ncbi:MAG TPA: recombinase family protein, partial [Rhodothermales bacterium]